MADNPSGPASAGTSAGSSPSGQAATASGTAGSATPGSTEQVPSWAKALQAEIQQSRAEAQNLRSLHDRQMNELREAVRSRPAGNGGSGRATAASMADSEPDPGNGVSRARDEYFEQDLALIKFRQLHSDWQEYWPEMEPILNDRLKVAPYAVYKPDGTVDYYKTFTYLRTDLERARLLKQKSEFDQSRAASESRHADAKRDATISGQGASSSEPPPDLSKMSYKEKMEWLLKNEPDLFDPDDLPEVLRKQ